MGTLGSNMYSLFLSFFYLCAVQFNMRDQHFRERYENKAHIVLNLCIWSSNIFLAATGDFYLTSGVCWIGPKPIDCIHNPDVECIRG
jgi:hypothetical protein